MYVTLRVVKIITETPDTKSFVLSPEGQVLPYVAGQFLTLVFPKPSGEERRNYSFSSSPETDDLPCITVKRIDNGEFSRQLFDHTAVGDALLAVGAFGYFTLPPVPPQQFLFLAAGSGIAPVLSLIKTILATLPAQKIVLIYSNRSVRETIFYDTLLTLAAKHPDQLTIEFLFSSAKDLSRARLGKWLLEKFVTQYVQDRYDTLVYICGPFDYMRMSTVVLLAEGIPDNNIRRENFLILKPIVREEPPDKLKHSVVVHIAGKTFHTATQFPTTILQQAKGDGIPIPYSCESGQCGTCAALCVSGKVWMSYNEVLTDNDLDAGRVLTCTGYPVGGDLVLKIE